MKRTLLCSALLISVYFSTNAQQNISFETTEGYSTAGLNGQNGWVVIDSDDEGTGPTAVLVSGEQHSMGSQSLKFAADEEDANLFYDVYKIIPVSGTLYSVSQDIYITDIDPENGSELEIITGDVNNEEAEPVTIVQFEYDGNINVMTNYDTIEEEPTFVSIGTVQQNTWYTLRTTYNTVAGTIAFYLNNQLAYTRNLNPGFNVNALGYLFDAHSTSYFIDNIAVTGGTAGIEQRLASKFSVSPNPATDIVNISNTTNAVLNKITLTDLKGRTVKTYDFAGIAFAQINITDLASGVYLLNIASDKGITTKKIVKN